MSAAQFNLFPREAARASILRTGVLCTLIDPYGTKYISLTNLVGRRDGAVAPTYYFSDTVNKMHSLTRYDSGILRIDQTDGASFISEDDGETWQQLV